jgi:uncharacterized transporter YbjL
VKKTYIPIGMLFLVLAIILPKIANIRDFISGFLYGAAIGILLVGLFLDKLSKKKQEKQR